MDADGTVGVVPVAGDAALFLVIENVTFVTLVAIWLLERELVED